MVDKDRFTFYLLIASCIGFFLLLLGPPLYQNFRPRYYGFEIFSINEREAQTGYIVHLTDTDLSKAPQLKEALLDNSRVPISLNKEQYQFYLSSYRNYTRNETVMRTYYEYHGTYFYLLFLWENVAHLGDPTNPA